MAIRLAPLMDFSLWGSDWGEYHLIGQGLVDTGTHPGSNLGWGEAYVDFPGMFDLAGAIALVTGVPLSQAMLFIVPCVTALSCLLVAMIVLRLGGDPWAAIISAAILAVIFPEVFQNSHPIPGAIGSVLVLAVMLLFLMGDVWRWESKMEARRPFCIYVLMMILLSALLVTHHMSMLFALLAIAIAHLLRAHLVTGEEPEREAWGIWTILTMMTLTIIFWLLYATTFRDEVMIDLLDLPGAYVMGGAFTLGFLVFIVGARILSSRRTTGPVSGLRPPKIPFSTPAGLRLILVTFLVSGLVIMVMGVTLGFPGTQIEPGMAFVFYFIPVLLVFTLGVGSTDLVLRSRGGHVIIAWLVALLISFLVSVLLQSQVLVSYRVLPYLVEVSVIFLGLGAIHLRRMTLPEGRGWSRGFGAVLTLLLVLLLATAYPPKDVMGGFQEGTHEGELSASLWLRGGLPAPGAEPTDRGAGTVASDHRLSSMAFGLGGQMATWDRGGELLHASPGDETVRSLQGAPTPQKRRPVTAVVLTEDYRSGAALFQWDTAEAVEGEAWDKFFEPPFIRLYDGGDVWVLGVSRPLEDSGQ